jgi:hypothetical protein
MFPLSSSVVAKHVAKFTRSGAWSGGGFAAIIFVTAFDARANDRSLQRHKTIGEPQET